VDDGRYKDLAQLPSSRKKYNIIYNVMTSSKNNKKNDE
jgi:hypothetical protein